MPSYAAMRGLKDKDVQFLNSREATRIATVDDRKRPHVVPIIYAFDNDSHKFHLITFKGTKKLRNMQQNKSVSIVVDEYSKSAKKGI